jgi:hypothetical protein
VRYANQSYFDGEVPLESLARSDCFKLRLVDQLLE